jgi:hypothetical protein
VAIRTPAYLSRVPDTLTITVTHTTTIGDLLVAFGTLALALFTYGLGRGARSEGSQMAEQVRLQRAQMEAQERPWVIPAPDSDWSWRTGVGRYETDGWKKWLPVKNVGPGAALNVQGMLDFLPPSGTKVRVIPTSLGPREWEDLRLRWDTPQSSDWQHVAGQLDYEDIRGGRWQTRFRLIEENGVRYVDVNEVRQVMRADGTVIE